MKKLIIALVFGIGLTAFAQEDTPKPSRADMEKMTPEQRQQKHLGYLTKELNLDAKQQEQVGQILSEKSAKMQDMKAQRKERKANADKITPEEKKAFKTQMDAEKADVDAKMKAILSVDQYQKWNMLKEDNKEKFRKRREEKRE